MDVRAFTVFFFALVVYVPAAHADNQALLQTIVTGATQSKSTSLVMIQDDRVVYENYFGNADAPHSVQSISKSVAALAVEVLLDRGNITSLDAPMSTWISGWASDPQKSKITLRMIMSQTSGVPPDSNREKYQPALGAPDLVAYSAAIALDAEPGTQFLYSSMGSSLLQPVIAAASGMSVTDFVNQNLLYPMDIRDATWSKDRAGHETVAGGLHISTADLIKIGKLLLNNGTVGTSQLLTSRAVREVTTKSQDLHNYGLFWWLEKPNAGPSNNSDDPQSLSVFYAYGYAGQFLVVYPEKRLIGVRTNYNNILVTDRSEFSAEEDYAFLTQMSKWQ